jgi:Zn-dependent peptidase ImmA (M78 family)
VQEKDNNWEDELWSYLSNGNGEKCPLGNVCQLTGSNSGCFNRENQSNLEKKAIFIDREDIKPSVNGVRDFIIPVCLRVGRIFQLVTNLAEKYRHGWREGSLPVPDNLITVANDSLPIEVRYITLKALHGAVWKTSNSWVVQINKGDTSARQRFTLYHEMFHILAHCATTPVFKNIGSTRGRFNEILADHFAAQILIPNECVAAKWQEEQDIRRMAVLFDVPEPVMYFYLHTNNLI